MKRKYPAGPFAILLTIIVSLACAFFSATPSPLHFEPDVLPAAQTGTAYEAEIHITENDTPAGGFAISKGSLPAGLELVTVGGEQDTAFLRGMPEEAGTFTFTIGVWCYGLNSRGGQTGEKEYSIVVENTEVETRPAKCAALDLTPEECANQGTHSYDFKTEVACTSVNIPEAEKFIVTFSESAVELEQIEPGTWSHQYMNVSTNQYVWKYEGVEGVPAQVTLEFNVNGFTLAGTETPECGKYIRTLLP